MKRFCFTIVFLLCGLLSLKAQETFYKRFSSDTTWGGTIKSIIKKDKSYYFTQQLFDTGNYVRKSQFVKTDLNGNTLLTSTIAFADTQIYQTRLIQLNHSEFVTILNLTFKGNEQTATALVKYDTNGNIILLKKYKWFKEWYTHRDVRLTTDKGLIMVGYIQKDLDPFVKYGDAKWDVLLTKLDSSGKLEWHKTFGEVNRKEDAHSIWVCNDGGYIIGGWNSHFNNRSGDTDNWVIKTDKDGNIEWQKRHGVVNKSDASSYGIKQTTDGGYIYGSAWGEAPDGDLPERYAKVVKLNKKGDLEWHKTFKGYSPNEARNKVFDVIETSNYFIAVGSDFIPALDTSLYGKNRHYAFIAKLNKGGNTIWRKMHHYPGETDPISLHWFYNVIPTEDKGYTAVGYVFPAKPESPQDAWLVKMDSNGCVINNCWSVGIDNITQQEDKIKIYPNPANHEVTLERENISSTAVVKLYSVSGQKVKEITLFAGESSISISLTTLPSGVYFYTYTEAGRSPVSGKLVIR